MLQFFHIIPNEYRELFFRHFMGLDSPAGTGVYFSEAVYDGVVGKSEGLDGCYILQDSEF